MHLPDVPPQYFAGQRGAPDGGHWVHDPRLARPMGRRRSQAMARLFNGQLREFGAGLTHRRMGAMSLAEALAAAPALPN